MCDRIGKEAVRVLREFGGLEVQVLGGRKNGDSGKRGG